MFTSAYINNKAYLPVDDFEDIFNKCSSNIIAGDFNARHAAWNCVSYNHRGSALLKYIKETNTELIKPPKFTHYSHGAPSVIDLDIYRNIHSKITCEVLEDFTSDHYPVLLYIKRSCWPDTLPKRTVTNWNLFTECLINSKVFLPSINGPQDIDREVGTLTDLIMNAHKEATRVSVSPPMYRLPLNIRNYIKLRNKARRTYQRTHLVSDRIEYLKLKNSTCKLIKDHSNSHWENYINTLTTEDNSIWKAVKKFKNKKVTFPPPPIKMGNQYAFSDVEKANAIAGGYETQFSLNEDLDDSQVEEEIDEAVEAFLATPQPSNILPATASEIVDIICKLKVKKCPGGDYVNNRMLVNLPAKIIFYLTHLVNGILKYQYFPQSWKTAVICAIPKCGANLSLPESYRPISLLSSLSKVAERVVHRRLTQHLRDHDILIPEQFGFRPKHATTHQLVRVNEFVADSLQNNLIPGALFLDIAKAYDKIWHNGLVYKLIQINLPYQLVVLISNYLSDRSFTVRVNNALSDITPIRSGVPQGSILGPTLFNIYINTIPRHENTTLALYADDTAILSAAHHPVTLTKTLQAHIDVLEKWFDKWKISVNPKKCQAIHFSRRKDPPRIYVNDSVVNWSNSVTYLGVTLDKYQSWNRHIAKIRGKMRAAEITISPLLYSDGILLDNKTLLYKTIIRPIASYAAPPPWSYQCKTLSNLLEAGQSKILRKIRKAHRFMSNKTVRNDLRITTLKSFILKISKNFYHNFNNIGNEIVYEIPEYDNTLPINRKRPRAVLLYDTYD